MCPSSSSISTVIKFDTHKNYPTNDTPKETKLRNKIRTLQQQNRRLRKKCTTLKNLLKELRKKNLLDCEKMYLMEQTFSGPAGDIIFNEIRNVNKASRGVRYSQEYKQFALTLHYYSAKAYEFVRKIVVIIAIVIKQVQTIIILGKFYTYLTHVLWLIGLHQLIVKLVSW